MNRSLIAACLGAALCATAAVPGPPQEPQTEEEASRLQRLWKTVREKSHLLDEEETGGEEEHGSSKFMEKVRAFARDLNGKYLPIIEEAGFEVAEIRVTVGLTAGVGLRVRRNEVVSQEKQEELLEEHREDAVLVNILEGLFATNHFKIEGFEIDEALVFLGIPPKTTVILTPIVGRRE